MLKTAMRSVDEKGPLRWGTVTDIDGTMESIVTKVTEETLPTWRAEGGVKGYTDLNPSIGHPPFGA